MQPATISPRLPRFGGGRHAAGGLRSGVRRVSRGLSAIFALPLFLAGCAEATAPPAPASLQQISGGWQVVTIPSEVSEPLAVRVVDGSGAPMAGVPVEWSADHGTISGSAVTGADGMATATWFVDVVGSSMARAAVEGLLPVHFGVSGRLPLMELSEFEANPQTVSVAEGPALVRFRARARSRDAVGDVLVRLGRPDGSASPHFLERVEGTAQDGWWEGEVEIPEGAPPGGWSFQVTVAGPPADETCHCLGYPRVIYPAPVLQGIGFSSVVEVVGGS